MRYTCRKITLDLPVIKLSDLGCYPSLRYCVGDRPICQSYAVVYRRTKLLDKPVAKLMQYARAGR